MADVDDVLTRLAQGIVDGAAQGEPLAMRLCRSATRVLGGDGAAITLAYTDLERVTLCTTDDVALTIEEAQDVMGQGPGPDAYRSGEYVRLELSPRGGADPRWPLLESAELSALAPAVVHAVPLKERRDDPIGVLTVYQRGEDSRIDVDSALVLGQVLAAALLADGPTQHDGDHAEWTERAEVHQATGMVVAQLGVPPSDAIALIRAHAYSHGQSVNRSAHAVVTRQLTFSSSADQEIEST
jgi:ANTAR domain-containing protein